MNFLNVKKNQVFVVNTPLDLKFIGDLRDHLKFMHPDMFYNKLDARNNTGVVNTTPMIKQILKKDILFEIANPSEFKKIMNK